MIRYLTTLSITTALISNYIPFKLIDSYRASLRLRSVHADLVLAILGQVLHPRRGLVARSVHNLQVSHLESRNREERNLEVDVDRLLLVEVSLWGFDGRQFEISAQNVFSAWNNGYLWPANCLMVHLRALCSGT